MPSEAAKIPGNDGSLATSASAKMNRSRFSADDEGAPGNRIDHEARGKTEGERRQDRADDEEGVEEGGIGPIDDDDQERVDQRALRRLRHQAREPEHEKDIVTEQGRLLPHRAGRSGLNVRRKSGPGTWQRQRGAAEVHGLGRDLHVSLRLGARFVAHGSTLVPGPFLNPLPW